MILRAVSLPVFWFSVALLAYTFVGYRWLIGFLAKIRPLPGSRAPERGTFDVCVILVVHNEENRIADRIENLLAADYPPEKLRVLLVSDGSTDQTVSRAEACQSPRVRLLIHGERSGKAACLNAAFALADSELVVFADARQRFAPDTIRRLAAHFSDPKIGAVSGALEIDGARSGIGSAVDAYWRFEKTIRVAEARFDSCIGCTGAVYAIRRALFSPIAPDTILDDVVIPMSIAVAGYRVLHDPAALAFDPQPLEPASERVRKRRTLAGNFQCLFRHPAWLVPWRNRLWWQLLSHKYLRLCAPAFLLLAFTANAALLAEPLYRLIFGLQCLFYFCAALGLLQSRFRSRILSLPGGFVFLNWSIVRAFWLYCSRGAAHRWEPAPPAKSS